jgi:MoaA/NifB/PqqE/SkfB family radical SAM enzyme
LTRSSLARMGLAYGASLLAYARERGPRPFSASFAVTNRCNLRCSYCNFPHLDPTELGLDQVALLFDRLADLGVVRLGLVGGEPLLRKDIGAIVALAAERGFFVSLNSNLMLYARHEAAFSSVDLVLTSLDGSAASHRENRGARSLDGVHSAIAELRERGKTVVAICVVNEHTLDVADALLDTAEKLDIRVHFQPQCSDTTIVRGSLSRTLSNTRLRAFWGTLLEKKVIGRPIASSSAYLEALSRWEDHFVSAYYDPRARCAAGRGFLFVDPRGDAFPCAYTKGKAPPVNLLERDYRAAFEPKTPCTRCSVGPMLEANLLFQRPLASVLDLLRSYR